MWADGDWGPKNGILNLADTDTMPSASARPIFIGPYNSSRPGTISIAGDTAECVVDSDERWHVVLNGEHWSKLMELIEDIRKLGVKEQIWTLTSWLSSQEPQLDRGIYRLNIVATQDSTKFKILQGSWKPSFENPKTVANWGV